MPELQSCYFCGTADDVTEYAVVPPRFADSEDEERSAVLCEQCKDKLMRVVEPLAEKLDAGAASESTRTRSSPTDSSPNESPRTTSAADDGIVMAPGTSAKPDTETTGESPESKPDLDAESPVGEVVEAQAGDDSPPANYRKAMRLLSNREFPMERRDVEELLAGAYDMENEEVAAVLAYATESGRLEAEDGTFTRG